MREQLTESVHFKLSSKMKQEIEKRAVDRNISPSAYIRMILSLHLNKNN